jgi:hypothetical protein
LLHQVFVLGNILAHRYLQVSRSEKNCAQMRLRFYATDHSDAEVCSQ